LTIGIGIIGAGMVGQMCHLANFVANPGCRVVALADLRPELAVAAAAKFGVQRVYRTHLELLADTEISGVVVVTRRRATGPIVLDALNSDRHVLSEKPMAYTAAQATTLVEAARQRNLVYSIGYMKRHDAGVTRAMALLARLRTDGSLGAIVSARGWCFAGETGGQRDNFTMTGEPRPDGIVLWPDGPDWMSPALRPGYDTFLNVFSHIINLARYALGASPRLVASQIPTSGAATATLEFDGIPCTLELANQATGVWREGLAIAFERGSLTIELPPPFAAGTEARVILDDRRGTSELAREISWAFRRQADAFVADIAQAASPLASGADSVADIALAEAIWQRHAAA
jgi:predicted dehydrogenase